MKKDFKAPLVEARELSVLNSVMDGPILISSDRSHASANLVKINDSNGEYDMWKMWKTKQE